MVGVIPFLKSNWRDQKYFLLIKKAQIPLPPIPYSLFPIPCSLFPKSLVIFENWYNNACYRFKHSLPSLAQPPCREFSRALFVLRVFERKFALPLLS